MHEPGFRLAGKSFFLPFLALGAVLIAFTFQEFNPEYGPGLDPPLAWVFNHTFFTGNELGRDFVFPHGPLSFLLYPLPMGHNILIALSLYTILKLIFFYQLCRLHRLRKPGQWVAPFLMAYVLFLFFEIQFVMLAVIVVGFSLYLETGNHRQAYIPVIVAALGLYMRAYIAVTGSAAVLAFLGILLWQTRHAGRVLRLLLFWCASVCLLWLYLFHSMEGFLHYLTGRFQLSLDNSTAASLYPENNWWLLSLSLLCLFLVPLVLRNRNVTLYCLFFFFLLFAQWKYSMARQDLIHSRGFVVMLVLFFSILAVHIPRRKTITLLLALFSIGFYYANLPNVYGYSEWNPRLIQLNRFTDLIFHYSSLEEKWKKTSAENCSVRILPDSIRKQIGRNTVDCYPWDYSFIPANDLHWQPRPALQSYASYTSWLDRQNAEHFNGTQAPQFMLWHLGINSSDPNGSTFETLDRRYALNDEPQTMLALLRSYTLKSKSPSLLLLEKRTTPLRLQSRIVKSETLTWNTWHAVPAAGKEWLRLKAVIRPNLAGALKSILYKSEAYYILLKGEDGQVYRYRIVPKNAADGLWINPLILHPENNESEPRITQVMLTSTRNSLQQDLIPVQWETTSAQETPGQDFPSAWFGKSPEPKQPLLESLNTIQDTALSWDIGEKHFDTTVYHTASPSWILDPGAFSFSFHCLPDTLPGMEDAETVQVHAGLWVKSPPGAKLTLVVCLEENGALTQYRSVDLDEFRVDASGWNFLPNNVRFPAGTFHKNVRLKIYAWNTGDKKIWIDDFQVVIKTPTFPSPRL